MTKEEQLQYASVNYSVGDLITRDNFCSNRDSTKIIEDIRLYHMFGDSVYLGKTQIFCGTNKVWAMNKTRENNEPNYEIY